MSMTPELPVDELMSRLSLIEDQSLDARAGAYTQLHDELRQQLEGKEGAARHG